MNPSHDPAPARHGHGHALVRRILKLVVEANSSRVLTSRLGSSLALLAILAAFALGGYGLAAGMSRYW